MDITPQSGDGLTPVQRWAANAENKEKRRQYQAAQKAKDPVAYAAKKREQYFKKHAQYRAYQNNWYRTGVNSETAKKRTKLWNRTLYGQFRAGQKRAKAINLPWSIELDAFSELRSRPCFYCGGKLTESGSGLDRKNNALGYVIDNVVPCCFNCNRHKGEDWSFEEALIAIRAVIEHRKKK